MIQHIGIHHYQMFRKILVFGISLSVVCSLLTLTVARDIVNCEQCMHHCLSQQAPQAMPHSSAHAMPPCCSTTVAFGGTHTCHMSSTTGMTPGSSEYPAQPIGRQSPVISLTFSTAAEYHAACSESHSSSVFYPITRSPVPPYLEYLSFRCWAPLLLPFRLYSNNISLIKGIRLSGALTPLYTMLEYTGPHREDSVVLKRMYALHYDTLTS